MEKAPPGAPRVRCEPSHSVPRGRARPCTPHSRHDSYSPHIGVSLFSNPLGGGRSRVGGEGEKGKPGERRGRKAPRLPHAFACHASRAAEPLREGSFMRSRTTLPCILTLLTALAACDLRPRSSTGVNDPVTRVVVSPDSTMPDPSQS